MLGKRWLLLLVGSMAMACGGGNGDDSSVATDLTTGLDVHTVGSDQECTPNCSERECGEDGCGGICGNCFTPEGAVDNLLCIENAYCCKPDCGGMKCGDNGCGGSCGECPVTSNCQEGQCIAPCQPDCTGKECGDDGCQGSCGNCFDTSGGIDNGLCQANGSCCAPQCGGKECGEDGCGGTCGTCPGGADCVDGSCDGVCIPDCDGKECGYDGCTGSCGTCGAGEKCQSGQCVDCEADCEDKECGSDGCGGSCGTCPDESSCDVGSCACDGGFDWNPGGDTCWPVCPENSTNDPDSGDCQCDEGFHWNDIKDQCWLDCVANASNNPVSGECECDADYEWNPDGDVCWPVCGVDSTYNPELTACLCNDGFFPGLGGFGCLDICPADSTYSDFAGMCLCDEGFFLNDDGTACEEPPQVCDLNGAAYAIPTAYTEGRFVRNNSVFGQPVINDLVTGLMWQGCDAGKSGGTCSSGTLAKKKGGAAVTYCDDLDWGGHTDWLLPPILDWLLVVDQGLSKAEDFFAYASGLVLDETYWSGTYPIFGNCPQDCLLGIHVDNPDDLGFEWYILYAYTSFARRTRCIRYPTPLVAECAPILGTTNEPVPYLSGPGLFWQGCTAGLSGELCEDGVVDKMGRDEAIEYCTALEWGGYEDWELPDLNYFSSIVDYTVEDDPLLNPELLPGTTADTFWTATDNGMAWTFDYQAGQAVSTGAELTWAVRCVRTCPGNYAGPDCLTCQPGWEGEDCNELVTCDGEPCFPGVVCADLPGGGVNCGACPPGYSGNGFACADIDGCSGDPCFPGVICANLPPPEDGFDCEDCPAGFYGDGISCTEFVDCTGNTEVCDENADCVEVIDGVWACLCPPGFDGDGLDCVATAQGFTSMYSADAPGFPWDFAVGDLNNDTYLDVAVVNVSGNKLKVFTGDGAGGLTMELDYYAGQKPRAVDMGDFNEDGDLDIVTARYNEDVVGLYLGEEGVNYTGTVLPVGVKPLCILVADVNEDTHDDILVGHDFAYGITLLLGDGAGAFAAPATVDTGGFNHWVVEQADFNEDDHLDLVLPVGFYDSVKIMLGNGDGTFGEGTSHVVGDQPFGVAVGDLNGDGHDDILAGNRNSDNVGMLFGDGTGDFEPVVNLPTGDLARDVTIADFNGDGTLDFAVVHYNDSNLRVFYGDGEGGFPDSLTITQVGGQAINGPVMIQTADFNKNGFPDLVLTAQTDSKIHILFN